MRGGSSGSVPGLRSGRARSRAAGRPVSVVLVDVRPRPAYEQGHLPGAVHLDPETDLSAIGPDPAVGGRHPLPDDAMLAEAFVRVGIDSTSFVLALDDGTGWAARCWWLLRHLGHDAAGTLDFRGYAGPLSTRDPDPAPGAFEPRPRLGRHDRCRRDPLAARRSARSRCWTPAAASVGCGEEEPLDPVAGRIPGADQRVLHRAASRRRNRACRARCLLRLRA